MARKRTRQANGAPWYRRSADGWYATINGQKVRLRDEFDRTIKGKGNRAKAELAVARLRLEIPTVGSPEDVRVADVADAYLEQLRRTSGESYIEDSTRLLNDFCSYCGALNAMELKRKHVYDWVDQHKGWKSDNTKRGNMIIVMAAFNHAVKDAELLQRNPLESLKKPAGFARATYFTEEEIQEILAYFRQPPKKKAVSLRSVGEYFEALLHTGARPYSELAKVTAENVQETDHGLVIRIAAGTDEEGNYRHKAAKKTGRARTIYMMADTENLIRRLMADHPRGSGRALFRTPRGRAWTHDNAVTHFCRMKKRLGWNQDSEKSNLSFYTCRHTFAKRVLSGFWSGQPATLETLAGLLGNTPAVAYRHYANWSEEYNQPLLTALGRTG